MRLLWLGYDAAVRLRQTEFQQIKIQIILDLQALVPLDLNDDNKTT